MPAYKCFTCNRKYEAYEASDWMEAKGCVDENGEPLEYPHEGMCPRCVDEEEEREREREELLGLRKQVNALRDERDQLLERVAILEKRAAPEVADLASDEPAAKKQKAKAQSVWVLHKGDWPCDQQAKLVDIEVLGTYSSRANAQAALEEFLEDGGWEKGWGYHQGESESNILIAETELDF